MQPFEHQAAALSEIVARARAFFGTETSGPAWRELSIKPRFASLIVAPTGVGKTSLALMAARALGRDTALGGPETVRLSVPGWIPAGSNGRTVAETISSLAKAVASNRQTLLVLDEIDKATSGISATSSSSSAWQQHCLLEIFDLLDGRWPHGLNLPDDDDAEEISREVLTKKLQESVFILGIGTFQDFFDGAASRRSIGFGAENTQSDEITSDDILEKLPRELVNRMNSQLIRLPELSEEHYHRIARQAEESLPDQMRQAFRQEINLRIQSAISAKKGVRFLEEALLEVLKSHPPEPTVKLPMATPLTPETNLFDTCML